MSPVSNMVSVTGWLVLFALVAMAEGRYRMVMAGCIESYVHMKCPKGEILSVRDVRLEINNGTHEKCEQGMPPESVPVPHEMQHLCDPKKEHCIWSEDICEHTRECVFYMSPHFIENEQHPTMDSEVIIQYECQPGGRHKAGVAVLICVIIVGTAAILVVGTLIVWKDCKAEQYDNFTNEPTTAPTGPSAGLENISVQLQPATVSGGAASAGGTA